jgi:hypothetical protein
MANAIVTCVRMAKPDSVPRMSILTMLKLVRKSSIDVRLLVLPSVSQRFLA